MYIMIQFTFRSLIFENCLYLLFGARELWIGISLPVEICREDGVWLGNSLVEVLSMEFVLL